MAPMTTDEPFISKTLTQPWHVHVDVDHIAVEYAFGPQGHPAAMLCSVWTFEESNWQTTMHVIGPGDRSVRRSYKDQLSVRLRACLLLGAAVQNHFGDNPFWWRCCDQCFGMTVATAPPYHPCPNCKIERATAEAETAVWLATSPEYAHFLATCPPSGI